MPPELIALDPAALDWVPGSGIAKPAAYLPSEYLIKRATERWEEDQAARLRREVFCEEQGLFERDDRDQVDAVAITIVAVSCVFGMPEEVVGTVRIHQSHPGEWEGSRLAVQRNYRGIALLGTELIHLAVSTAHGLGARRFTARVQSQNAPMFRRLHWTTLETLVLHGKPHHRMEASLSHYPPCASGHSCFVTTLRQAA